MSHKKELLRSLWVIFLSAASQLREELFGLGIVAVATLTDRF